MMIRIIVIYIYIHRFISTCMPHSGVEHMYPYPISLHKSSTISKRTRYSLAGASPSREPSKEPPIPERNSKRTVTEIAGLRWTVFLRVSDRCDVQRCWNMRSVEGGLQEMTWNGSVRDVKQNNEEMWPWNIGMIPNWPCRTRLHCPHPLLEGQVVAHVPGCQNGIRALSKEMWKEWHAAACENRLFNGRLVDGMVSHFESCWSRIESD